MLSSSTPSPRPRPPARRASAAVTSSLNRIDTHTKRSSLSNLTELSELLTKADELIKERELELDNTSFTCKTLHENNVAIKSKHQALLARISSGSPIASPVSSPHPPFNKRTLKVSQSDISTLYDDNAALLQKLETLEAEHVQESSHAARALRKLEGEISGLREELAQVTARSDELERRAKDNDRERNRQMREQRMLATRLGSRKEESTTPNFAPASIFSRSVSAPTVVPESEEEALVSKLLTKIEELEETNAAIKAKQEETFDRLRSVQRETECIGRAYECLNNPDGRFEVEIVPDNEEASTQPNQPRPNMGVVRFRSLRKSLDLSSFAALANDESFDKGIEEGMRSSVRGDILSRSLTQQHHKGRPSLVGLFDPPEDAAPDNSIRPSSPALSVLSLPEQQEEETPARELRSLESELGDAWPQSPIPSHTRNQSLYETLFGVESGSPQEPSKHLEVTTHAARLSRMSQTIRMKHSKLAEEINQPAPAEDPTALGKKFSRAFDAVVDQLLVSNEGSGLEMQEEPAPKQPMEKRAGTLSAILIELWLWLQFTIIILVFLWTMARKGPREVLQEADRRRLSGREAQ